MDRVSESGQLTKGVTPGKLPLIPAGAAADVNASMLMHIGTASGHHTASRSRKSTAKAESRRSAEDPEEFGIFRRLCDAILSEVRELGISKHDQPLPDDWRGAAAEIETLLEKLYSVQWGKPEALKRVVSAILFQIANAEWDGRHVLFLDETIRRLRVRYAIDSSAVDECQEDARQNKLDSFRGTLAEPKVLKRFKIVEDAAE